MSPTHTIVVPDARDWPHLGALLDDALLAHPSEVALVEADRHREVLRWSYRELRQLALRVAARLDGLGVGPDVRVAILAGNQARWLVSAIAAFRLGAILVPLDYKLTATEWRGLLDHAKPHILVADWHIARQLPPSAAPHILVLDAPPDAPLDGRLRWDDLPEVDTAPRHPRSPTDIATIVYSSGTGGRPKGCVLDHRAYLHQLSALLTLHPMAPGKRFFSFLPTNHAIDFVAGFLGPLLCGATVVHQRTLRPEFLVSTLQRYAPSHLALVPAILSAFDRTLRERTEEAPGWRGAAFEAARGLNQWWTARGPDRAVSQGLLGPVHAAFGGGLEVVFCGGAWTDRAMAERFYAVGIPVLIGYGLTEACTVATLNRLRPYRADSVGPPVDGVEVRIVDPDAEGVGEVWLRGPTLFRGYLDDPELTAETLTPDGWLRTGDLGRLDASWHLHLSGRRKDVIVTHEGKNLYPEDVAGAFSDVACEEIAIFAENYILDRRGMVDERLVAVVRVGATDPSRALAAANQRLPGYKRISAWARWSEPFPRTATQKIKRIDLARRVRDAAPSWEPL